MEKIIKTLEGNTEKLNQLAESQKSLFKEVINLEEEVSSVKRMLKHKMIPEEMSSFTSKITLPIDSMENLLEAECELRNENEFYCLQKKLTSLGGSRLSSLVNNIMKTLLTKNVALMYSLKGKGKKLAFQDLKLYSCVIGEFIM